MKTELNPNEKIVKQGAANLQRGAESVGGKLYLTNDRLLFESHAFNVQKGNSTVPLADITQTSLCWTRFLNIIPLAPNSLAVATRSGDKFRFVLFGRSSWKDAIDGQATLATENA